MDVFRVVVCKEGKPWCCIDVEHLEAHQVVRDVAGRFPAQDGFDIAVMKRVGERRLLESSPSGVKLISTEPLFEPQPFD